MSKKISKENRERKWRRNHGRSGKYEAKIELPRKIGKKGENLEESWK